MVTDIVDLRVAKAGLVGFLDVADAAVSLSEVPTLDLAGAGEAGVMLSLFLASPEVALLGGPLDEDIVGRALRAAMLTVEGLALLVVGFSADFGGLTVFIRAPICLSIDAAVRRVDLRSFVD